MACCGSKCTNVIFNLYEEFFCLLSCSLFFLFLSIFCFSSNALTYSDVSSNHWSYEAIDFVSDKGIMIGTT
ncbi:MAG: S-layer homology domain-containing protein, partial [Clostridia bacterium]|nr:S-layer homology domain-containing protein [Clostridia bacterium]